VCTWGTSSGISAPEEPDVRASKLRTDQIGRDYEAVRSLKVVLCGELTNIGKPK